MAATLPDIDDLLAELSGVDATLGDVAAVVAGRCDWDDCFSGGDGKISPVHDFLAAAPLTPPRPNQPTPAALRAAMVAKYATFNAALTNQHQHDDGETRELEFFDDVNALLAAHGIESTGLVAPTVARNTLRRRHPELAPLLRDVFKTVSRRHKNRQYQRKRRTKKRAGAGKA